MFTCECSRQFGHRTALRQHRRETHSRDCPYCVRKFTTSDGLEQHITAIHPWQCGHCKERFRSLKFLNKHRSSTTHCFCRSCNEHFDLPVDLIRHQKTASHVDQFRCCDCERDFASGVALEQHLRDKKHTIRPKQKETFICDECNRNFLNKGALQQHRRSLVHHPISNLKCFDTRCQKHFKCPSSLLHHLESGACASGLDREKLNNLICAYDTDCIISGQRLINAFDHVYGESSDGSSDTETIYTPNSTSSDASLSVSLLTRLNLIDLELEEKAAPGNIRCRDCTKTFASTTSLEQHRNSAAHARSMFHCPIVLLDGKHASGPTRSFTTLGGLAQHLEAKACVGGAAMLDKAAAYLEDRFQQIGWQTKILARHST